MVANAEPSLRGPCRRLLRADGFPVLLRPLRRRAIPSAIPASFTWATGPDDASYYGHYGMLNTEARIASYLGIARGQLPAEHYYRMFRTLPEGLAPQEQTPRGETREYRGVKVFEGSYEYRGVRIVPSWGGSMFEALMVTLFVPEDVWAPRSWGINHPLYVRAQIAHGLRARPATASGASPRPPARGGDTGSTAWTSWGPARRATSPTTPARPSPPGPRPHALDAAGDSLASASPRRRHPPRVVPRPAVTPRARRSPTSRPWPTSSRSTAPLGFLDSVDVADGMVAGSILALDQGMIMAAIANELADDAMQHAFSDGLVERAIRPLIAVEEFSAGLPGQLIAKPSLVLQQQEELSIATASGGPNPRGWRLTHAGTVALLMPGTRSRKRTMMVWPIPSSDVNARLAHLPRWPSASFRNS